MASGVAITKDSVKRVVEGIKQLAENRVLVGIPSEKGPRTPEPGEVAEPLNNAAIGYIQENGAPEANIPARPWLFPGVRENKDKIMKPLEQSAKAVLSGAEASVAQQGLVSAGLLAVNAVRKKITDGPFVPLAPSTVAARKARGRTGTRPLIDSGQLRRAVSFVIRKAP